MIIRKLSNAILEQKPYEAWNAFVDLLAEESYQDLNDVQRVAHLCFWYDSEVQNGGHLQYFENRGITLLDETLSALLLLGAECQHAVLEKVAGLFNSKPRDRIGTFEEYVATVTVVNLPRLIQATMLANRLFKSCWRIIWRGIRVILLK